MGLVSFFEDVYALSVARAPRPVAWLLRPRLWLKRSAASRRGQQARRRTIARQGTDLSVAHFSWYRGEHTNYNPTKINLREADAIDRYILNGWVPEAPFIAKSTPVVAFGSCFAGHISRHLHARGFNVLGQGLDANAYVIRFGEGMVNSFAIRQQFEWAFEGRAFSDGLWRDTTGHLLRPEDEVRAETLAYFEQADVFIITLGLSEVWSDRTTGEVFWRAIPADRFDPERHAFRVSTPEENLENLRVVLQLIRGHRPQARLVLTLSPVPLVATFRPVSCVTANSVSKAVLRVAVDQLMREYAEDKGLYYFPSYEIVTSCFRDPYQLDNRHIRPAVVATIMDSFVRHYAVAE